MESLREVIGGRIKLLEGIRRKGYCVCKRCGEECKKKDRDGISVYDIERECVCGGSEYEVAELIENDGYVIKVVRELVRAYRNEIHEYLVPSRLADKEEQIRGHIKDILVKVKPIVEERIGVIRERHRRIAGVKNGVRREERLSKLKEYYSAYAAIEDELTALVAFRHFETFCMYIDSCFGNKKPFASARHLFKGFYYYANSMVLNRDVHFIEKQCFAGAGKSVTDAALMAFILGYDINSNIFKVFGNKDNIKRGIDTLVTIMTSPAYGRVFPYYGKFNGESRKMFSVCLPSDGQLKVRGSVQPTSVLMRSKNDSFDGVRVQYLFVDDITQSKDAEKLERHKDDIDKFNRSWFERKDNVDDTFIIASGTTYHQEDLLSYLKHTFGVACATPTPFKFTSISDRNLLGLPWLSVFCVIYGLDKNDKSTFEERFPTSVFLHKRKTDYRNFMAMVQQQPQPPQGSPFDYDNLPNLYGEEGIPHLPDKTQEVCTASLDPARKGKDFHSMPIVVTIDGKKFLKDCIFEASPPEYLPNKIVSMIEKHHIVHLDIENNTTTDLKQLIRKLLQERGIDYCLVTDFFSYVKKEDKIRDYETAIKSIYFPARGVFATNSPMGQFMYWLNAYNYDTPPKHDDSVDSLANYSQRFIVNKSVGCKVKTLQRGRRF